jgi:hypothetical protein
MLVDHLADGILEKNHKLVKRFDLTLQLDAIDQIY